MTAEAVKARRISPLRKGTVRRLSMRPWYFMMMMEEEGFWKALLMMPMIMRPGTRNWR